ncbi:MAG: hypothetical protein ABI880_08170 [Acidobacteriota bacterium]
MRRLAWLVTLVGVASFSLSAPDAQAPRPPTAHLVPAAKLTLPGRIDSNNPLAWHEADGEPILTAITSWGGVPELARGRSLESLTGDGPATFENHPGHGVWMEAVIPDAQGAWYGYYHHERPADECGRPDRQLPRIGAARSTDQGRTWIDLGIVLDAPPGSAACSSTGRFVLGGVGDVSAMLDHDGHYVYLFFSQYERDPAAQGVAVARMVWADRDTPVGAMAVWNDDAWLPASPTFSDDDPETPTGSIFPVGTPLVRATRPFHDGNAAADVFWGPAVHWNTYLEQYVMLLNRADNEQFKQEGIYVSFAPALDDPRAWSGPAKIMNGGEWYPQAVGLEAGQGTDRLAGARARFFITGTSSHLIVFER